MVSLLSTLTIKYPKKRIIDNREVKSRTVFVLEFVYQVKALLSKGYLLRLLTSSPKKKFVKGMSVFGTRGIRGTLNV